MRGAKQIFALSSFFAALWLLVVPLSAGASFGLKGLDVSFNAEDGSAAMSAGIHPYAWTTTVALNSSPAGEGELPDGEVRDVITQLPAGLTGNPTSVEPCPAADFLDIHGSSTSCPDSSALGVAGVRVSGGSPLPPTSLYSSAPIYNLTPPPGIASKIGFIAAGLPVTVEVKINSDPPYNLIAYSTNIPQQVIFYGAKLTVWGNPASPAHDGDRGHCAETDRLCEVSILEKPFVLSPRSCKGPLQTVFDATSWLGDPFHEAVLTHGDAGPEGFGECDRLAFGPSIAAKPTSAAATSPTGLDFSLDVEHNEGLGSPAGASQADVSKTVVTLPEGFTVNPSVAEGLAVCSEAQLAAEEPGSAPGAGCPQASKLGTIEVETPLLEDTILKGSLFQATPYENPFGSLIALYVVIKEPRLGIMIRQPLRVEPDPATGQLVTVAEDMPEQPFSHFRLHFREGARSPLVTPPACGSYQAKALLYPSSGKPPLESSSTFQIVSGPDESPCPSGGLPPFHPKLLAGTRNNAAGAFSPFDLGITRADTEQEITHFSIKLPPGVAGKLAGIPFCSDAAIAKATSRNGPHGGREELEDPSCPAASRVGNTLAGSGVGGTLAYAPGKIYLAGPYHGHPISLVSITSGVVGPFDIGTVVVRLAIDVNPETGEVFLDSTGSDPIPHIVKGIPIHLRDIRAYTDRPEFTFNPTSCERKSTAATVLGSGLDFVSAADDNPFVSTSPFQAADCAALPFAPKLSLKLLGGTKRGDYPKLRAFLRMHGFGEAGVARAQVTLPRSEFIANAHFNTICTRVQFKQAGGNGEDCPQGSIYGWARAKTPILSEPLEGPVFLRSSEHQLPDVVASLRGQEINVHLVGHVDSVKGRLRNTFEAVPDAPVEWASFSFQGGKKGLFENSTDLCVGTHRADVRFTGQNGKRHDYKPAVKVKCKSKARHRKHHRQKRPAR